MKLSADTIDTIYNAKEEYNDQYETNTKDNDKN